MRNEAQICISGQIQKLKMFWGIYQGTICVCLEKFDRTKNLILLDHFLREVLSVAGSARGKISRLLSTSPNAQ
jgi:hypothetical protein